MDVAAIEPGRDFRKAIDHSVATCTVLLAMMGHDWLDTADAAGRRRLEDSTDFVRIELASALRRDIPVIPVLVRGAKMPTAEQLPDDLKELAFRNALELTHARWKSDVQVLIRALQPYMGDPLAEKSAAGAGEAQRKTAHMAIPQPAASSPAAPAIGDLLIERVSRQLAAYIGPISGVVVKRAAKKSATLEEFYAILAEEIKVESDRARFLRACRTQY